MPLDEKKAGGYLTFGLFSHGNMHGLTRKTHDFPFLCRYLNLFGKFHLKEHGAHWTSFSISVNQAVNLHLDGHNSPGSSNYTCSFGQFDGGQLWVELTEGCNSLSSPVRWKTKRNGQRVPGHLHSTHHQFVQFDPKSFHATDRWTELRISLTFYTSRLIAQSDETTRTSLRRMSEILHITHARKSGTRWLSWVALATVACVNYYVNKEALAMLRIFSRVLILGQKVVSVEPSSNSVNLDRKLHGFSFPLDQPGMAYAVTSQKEALEGVTKSELEGLLDTAQKLHRRFGHPTNSLLVKNLRARGASPKLLAVAAEFKCDVCLENQIRASAPSASLEREDRLWCALQIDGFYMRFGQEVFHFLLMVDEASGFCQVEEVMRPSEKESRNVTTAQVVRTLESRWCQLFGFPEVIKLDPEGAFRGLDLGEYCASRGIEL
ncbi:hypothetical protein AK812_SmicGene18752 [Symbiodinium microadriaticum]|uniref:Integrase catalytic domain-containing protein n=1 Tax=Symbiodinium microadriaticum TaxID=2951 RepID=A0A1Q9DUA8_SYMMI|nr:hypothetical protein AK812_SmicGene18752 [Symbiodinium microadriaticum]